MNRRFVSSLSSLVIAFSLCGQTRGAGQSTDPPGANVADHTASPSPAPDDGLATATIAYTGKLLGYMRLNPNQLDSSQKETCALEPRGKLDDEGLDDAPEQVKKFLCYAAELKANGAVLLGMGDNLAPYYLSRYEPGSTALKIRNKPVRDDSVAGFLHAAGYDAVVPGKEDFYFGVYRLRQIGKLLNGIQPGTVMFADNLAFEPKEDKKRQARDRKKTFKDGAEDGITTSFAGKALPWIHSLTLTTTKVDLSKYEGWLCQVEENPDTLNPDPKNCTPWERHSEKECTPSLQKACWTTFVRRNKPLDPPRPLDLLDPGDYIFAITNQECNGSPCSKPKPYGLPVHVVDALFSESYVCIECDDDGRRSLPDGQATADSGILKNNKGVAIFAVVDEDMRSYISRENAGVDLAKDGNDRCSSNQPHDGCRLAHRKEIEVLPPATALQQTLDHFRRVHPHFQGVTVLLAQMTRPKAEELARHISFPWSANETGQPRGGAFDVVIAKAELAYASANFFLQIHRQSDDSQQDPLSDDPRRVVRRLLPVVPTPIFDTAERKFVPPLSVLQLERSRQVSSYCNSIPGDLNEIDCPKTQPKKILSFLLRPQETSRFPLVVAAQQDTASPPPSLKKVGTICRASGSIDQNQPWGYLSKVICDKSNSPGGQGLKHDACLSPHPPDFETGFKNYTLCVMTRGIHVPLKSGAPSGQRSGGVRNADVAILQSRDFYFGDQKDGGDLGPLKSMQKVLDRILWKGDLLATVNLSGAQIQALLKKSKQYKTEEDNPSIILPDTTGRDVKHDGVLVFPNATDPATPSYFAHLDNLPPEGVVRVATSNHLAMGDTGYPDVAVPATGGKPEVFASDKAIDLSALVCNALQESFPNQEPKSFYDCRVLQVTSDYTIPKLQAQVKDEGFHVIDNRPFQGNLYRWRDWVKTRWSKDPYSGGDWEKRLESYPLTEIVLEKAAAGYNLSDPLTSFSNLKNFAGVAATDVNQPTSSKLDLDGKLRALRRWSLFDLGGEAVITYTRLRQDSLSGSSNTSWPRNNWTAGPLLQWHGWGWQRSKYRPHVMFVLRPFQVGMQISDTTINLNGASGTSIALNEIRSMTLSQKGGVRYEKDTATYMEAGLQDREDINVLTSVTFNNGAVPCFLNAKKTLAACASPVVFNGTPPAPDYATFHQKGLYWDGLLSFPLLARITYQLDSHGDFFANRATVHDTTTLTRYEASLGNSLKMGLFGNFSLQPRLEWIHYQNKVVGNQLTRFNTLIQLNYSFIRDSRVGIWNAMAYKAPNPSK